VSHGGSRRRLPSIGLDATPETKAGWLAASQARSRAVAAAGHADLKFHINFNIRNQPLASSTISPRNFSAGAEVVEVVIVGGIHLLLFSLYRAGISFIVGWMQ
jgi:hypothetical protein